MIVRTLIAAAALVPMLANAQPFTPAGNPGALVAAESALARLARDKGARAALIATADDRATVLAPAPTPVKVWLKAHDAAALFVDRQTGAVWVSCDGSAGISSGTWGSPAQGGWFALVWQRQRKGGYRWIMADAAPLPQTPPPPDWISGKVADCPARERATGGAAPRPLPAAVPPAPAGSASVDGRSDDGSLVWRSTVTPVGARSFSAWLYRAGAMTGVIERASAAPAG